MSAGAERGPSGLDRGSLRSRTAEAVADAPLRRAVRAATDRFVAHRTEALDALDDADGLRAAGRAVRAACLRDLPDLLERLADRVLAAGGHVCWAADAAEAAGYVAGVARRTGARTVVKAKSMVTEEIGLNDVLAAEGCEVVETDLGERIVQLAGEPPSHIIAPALHRDRHACADALSLDADEPVTDHRPEALAGLARRRLRARFLAADLGITGVNLAVADTGSLVVVTNEGNASLTMALPRVHVAVLGAERVVATWEQAELMLSLLVRSATGQRLSAYTEVVSGPRGPGEIDGPEEWHLVVLDNGRGDVLGSDEHEMLACIRCGACLNVCPVYRQVGGHAYGWVYPGPMGSVLTPLLHGGAAAAELPLASTLCGACEDACPVGIPLPDLLLRLRRERAEHAGTGERAAWAAWAAAWAHPAGYRASGAAARFGTVAWRGVGHLPLAERWHAGRELPRPAPQSFRTWWEARSDDPPAPSGPTP